MKYVKKFLEHFAAVPAFTARDAKLFLSSLGASEGYAQLFLSNMQKRGLARRIRKGVYSMGNDPAIAGFAYSPSYHGLQDALSILGLWGQGTNTVLLTPLHIRAGEKEILGGKVLVRHISRKMFFGFGPARYFDKWILSSDVEKTLIDFVYFREPLADEALTEIKKRLDRKKLKGYLARCPKRLRERVNSILQSSR